MKAFAKPLAVAAIGFGALAAGTAAEAGTDVFLQIGVPGVSVGYAQPQPYYYVQDYPTYPAYPTYRSHRRYDERGPWGDVDRDGVPNLYDRDSRRYDADRDGVPNRYDRAPRNPYRY
ncbi:MAG: hypothetical protein HY854_13960 [Burkholderiales bacterium]|nr:hypothetical protein [Burkholderiales bacterium]